MALSGSTNFEPNVAEFIEEAFERCGLELRTGYDLKTARRSINFLLAEWANRGLNQWTIEQATQTVTQGTASYTLNSNVIDVLDLKDQFKDIDVVAKENKLLVESYEARIKELERIIEIHQREVDDIWKGMDALANPLG